MKIFRDRHSPPVAAIGSGILLAGWIASSAAISPDNAPEADNRPDAERATFSVHEDFEVTLYADESLGIANPIAIHWDPRGRLWVLCTLAYAQLKPGEVPDDKLFILEDTDGDHRADRSILFADGLNMPTGFALGNGGVYLAEGESLLFLRDTDGDDQSDHREVVLTGFGTGDTHQNISNLIFDPGGFLYFSQGLHTFSQVETPWGVSRGDTAGFWRFDPRTARLDPFGFPSMTSQNPCGIAFDRWGALFIKSNGPHLCFATPGLIPTTHPRELMQFAQVGQTPGKSMGGEIVESAHLPGWIQGQAIIAGYFAREVSALPLVEEGSGFSRSAPTRLVYGGHSSFRPVDIRQGPDGGIYVADWFNPIINHYQVSLRHPDRDYTHGRIWRITARDRSLAPAPNLADLQPTALFEHLNSGEKWNREQARRLLIDHPDASSWISSLGQWIAEAAGGEAEPAVGLVEAAGVLESHEAITNEILDRLQASSHPHVRATVARLIGRSGIEWEDAAVRLAVLLRDPHPRPRLEAVIACANRPEPDSLERALTALDSPVDPFIDYALGQSIFALEASWLDRTRETGGGFSHPDHLAFVLEVYGGVKSAQLARNALAHDLPAESRERLMGVLARAGNPEDLSRILDYACQHPSASLLGALQEASNRPKTISESSLGDLIDSRLPAVRSAAIRLVGRWGVRSLVAPVERVATSESSALADRIAAVGSLASLEGEPSLSPLREIAGKVNCPPSLRNAALEAMASIDLAAAATTASSLIGSEIPSPQFSAILAPLLNRGGGAAALAGALEAANLEDPRIAQEILSALNQRGETDQRLIGLLNGIIGIRTGAPPYDPERVASLVTAIRSGKGDPIRGKEVYQLAALSCVACHRIGDAGGVIGPNLTTVGAGLPLDQIVESILWPSRQIKEGYQALALQTVDGKAITGYLEREGEDLLWYRNTTTPWILPLAKKDIARREVLPTLMPSGLTHSLTDQQFLDLIAYLESLKGAPIPKSPN